MTDYKTMRVPEDAWDDAKAAKRPDETWGDYLRRCVDAGADGGDADELVAALVEELPPAIAAELEQASGCGVSHNGP